MATTYDDDTSGAKATTLIGGTLVFLSLPLLLWIVTGISACLSGDEVNPVADDRFAKRAEIEESADAALQDLGLVGEGAEARLAAAASAISERKPTQTTLIVPNTRTAQQQNEAAPEPAPDPAPAPEGEGEDK